MSCAPFDPLLAERAAGEPIAPADAARLDAHLATCARCRAELSAYQDALGLARLPAVSDAERQSLSQLSARVRAELRRAPVANALRRILVLGLAAAAVIVVVANTVVIPSARRGAEPPVAAAWKEPDVDELLSRVEKEHAELAIASLASDDELTRAELIADAAYQRALADE